MSTTIEKQNQKLLLKIKNIFPFLLISYNKENTVKASGLFSFLKNERTAIRSCP